MRRFKDERAYDEGEDPDTDWEAFAKAFVERLVSCNYDDAWAMTSASYKAEDTIEAMKRFTERVLISKDKGAAGSCRVGGSIEEWPAKEQGVLGAVSVEVTKGEDENVELMTILVMREGPELKIRRRWGPG